MPKNQQYRDMMYHGDLSVRNLFNVEGKIVVVTGGGRGIGGMITRGFVENGATVYITSRKAETCQQMAEYLTSKGPGRCIAVGGGDLSVVSNCKTLGEELAKREERVHVLVNNSGCSWGESFEQHPEKGWDKVMDLNVKGLFYATQALYPLLKKGGLAGDPARIINISSIAGVRPQAIPTYGYDASKAAVNMLTAKFASEFAKDLITVNAICPGLVPSGMSEQLLTYAPEDLYKSAIPIGRIGLPSDMAGAASWITGTCLPVDGGALVALRTSSAIEAKL